jgi:glycosyltransferase involved in cell wall biosynthesis
MKNVGEKMKILILTNAFGGLYYFRKELVEKLLLNNEVTCVLPYDSRKDWFEEIGCKYIEVPVNRRGINPIKDLQLFFKYLKLFKEIKPDVILTYTIKPNIYGGLAATISNVPYIPNITGLGSAVSNKGLLNKFTLVLYRFSLKKAANVFFQNETNKQYLIEQGVVTGRSLLIPGSGVNLEKYSYEEYPANEKKIRLLFIGRVMKEKGIEELLEAAETIKKVFQEIIIDIVGGVEESYQEKLNEFQDRGLINYHGQQKDVKKFIKKSHAIINPSYHEGMSNVLLESASTGRPVLASNIPGCKETFDEGISGFGFKVRDVDSLVNTIIKFVELSYEQKKNMGLAGRHKMEREFNRNIIVNAYLQEIDKVFNKEN